MAAETNGSTAMLNLTSNVTTVPSHIPSCSDTGAFGCINPHLEAYAKWYWGIHGYLSLVICTFGITTNALNIIILTRGAMRTPINSILTAIAVCDLITMCSYIPFASHFYIECGLEATEKKYSYGWTVFMAFHSNISLTTHASSMWLAVFMAILRYVYLQTKKCCNVRRTCILCVFIGVTWCFFMVPNYILTGVIEVRLGNQTLYRLNEPAIGSDNPSNLAVTAFWLIAVLGKLVPCSLISIFIGLLLKTLHESAARRKRLFANMEKARSGNNNSGGGGGGGGKGGSKRGSRESRHQCTTTMLLVIIVMYIVTEIPQVFFIIMSAMSRNFFRNVYMLLADTLDMIALINNAINFVLYCTMSQQFREHLMVVKACTGASLPSSTRFGKKTYQSVEQSCVNTHTTNNHADNGLCVTGVSAEKSVSHV